MSSSNAPEPAIAGNTINNYVEWRSYVLSREPQKPSRLTVTKYKALQAHERDAYNASRHEHHKQICWVDTPSQREVVEQFEDRVFDSKGKPAAAARGLILNGPATAGKTSIVTRMLRSYEWSLRSAEPESFDHPTHERIPILYVQAPSPCTPKTLTQSALEYLGASISGTSQELTKRLAALALELQVEVIVFDDISNVTTTAEGKAVDNHIKNLISKISACPIFIGVDLDSNKLFTGDNAQQNLRRHRWIEIGDIGADTLVKRDDKIQFNLWKQIVKSFESELVLLRHQKDDLLGIADYLHSRTQGNLYSLSELLTSGARRAIKNESERLTEEILDQIKINRAAELGYKAYKATQNKK